MDMSTAISLVVVGLVFYGLIVHRFTAKRERARAERRASRFELHYRSHRCPVTVVEVERSHDPWKRLPWMEVG